MNITQSYELMNDITKETLGESAILEEDLSNIVDIGRDILDTIGVDKYVKTLVDHIGKVVFVNRAYAGNFPSIMRDSWEFGCILEKISAELPEAEANESWELEDNTSYDPNIFYKPTVTATFYNHSTTFEIPMSIADKQVRGSFSNGSQLSAFFSMLENAVQNSMTIKIDGFISRLVNNMIAETVASDYADLTELGDGSGIKAVNVLYLYNTKFNKTLTADECYTDPDFIRFVAYLMGVYSNRMSRVSTLFNVKGKARFTSRDRLSMILLSDFKRGADTYLQSDVFHNEFTALPTAEEVPYWQGSGTDYSFGSISSIDVTTASEQSVALSGILGVMFDRDAICACNEDRRVTTYYNPKAEFTNYWHKWKMSGFEDLAEQFVVFFVADPTETP